MDAVERLITRAVRKSKDGRIDTSDFLNEAQGSMRYGMFTPMEVGKASHGLALALTRGSGQYHMAFRFARWYWL